MHNDLCLVSGGSVPFVTESAGEIERLNVVLASR